MSTDSIHPSSIEERPIVPTIQAANDAESDTKILKQILACLVRSEQEQQRIRSALTKTNSLLATTTMLVNQINQKITPKSQNF